MIRVPTRRRDWRLMGRTARLVLSVPGYALLAGVVAVAALALFVFSLNLPLVGYAVTGDLAIMARVRLLVAQFPFVGPSFTTVQGLLLVGVAALTGVDVTMAVYHFREHGISVREGGSGLLLLLPLDGLEFALGSGLVLLLSVFWLADGMRGGEINGCPVDI
ncbi:hypothetical protein BRD04_00430 [Halobacteriales archaeon QS_9_67_17]|nr:MAG: hypothetical protein BRD04_00430 [Halobacteriales archaeon QS_9_67_17]